MSSPSSSLVVVGSVAIDWVITPHAERRESVGGSATFFSFAAAPLAKPRLVGVVGADFPEQTVADLVRAGVDVEGLERIADGKTFRWKGRYHENMVDRDTLETHLNVFERFDPKLPPSYGEAELLFLANIQPALQGRVLDQMRRRPRLVGLDTMNLWIDIARDDLLAVLARVDVLFLNEQEARQLSGCDNLVKAARAVQALGPAIVIIKQGEHGALMFGPGPSMFSCPGLPLEEVVDPTGAGDCFAGGFMGHLARLGRAPSEPDLRAAIVYGSVMASYCVQDFSYEALRGVEPTALAARYEAFVKLAALPASA